MTDADLMHCQVQQLMRCSVAHSPVATPLCMALTITSSLIQIFDGKTAELLTYHQTEIKQIFPREGWVEQNPKEILSSVKECIEKAVGKLQSLNTEVSSIKGRTCNMNHAASVGPTM